MNIKVKRGALIGRYFRSLEQAEKFYNSVLPAPLKKHQSIIEFKSGECMVVGNDQIEAIRI